MFVTQDTWALAFVLMSDHGQGGACQIVAAGMGKTLPDDLVQYRRWEAIADCLNAVAAAHGTAH